MNFEENHTYEKVGQPFGFLFAYFLFTTILNFMLSFLNKIPDSWNYAHVAGITLLITLIGILLKKYLQ